MLYTVKASAQNEVSATAEESLTYTFMHTLFDE